MKVFEVYGELSLKDTLTQDLAAAQAKVNAFATGLQNTMAKASSATSKKTYTKAIEDQFDKVGYREDNRLLKESLAIQKEFNKRIGMHSVYMQKVQQQELAFKKAMNNQRAAEEAKALSQELSFKKAMQKQMYSELRAREIEELKFKSAMNKQRFQEEAKALSQELAFKKAMQKQMSVENNQRLAQELASLKQELSFKKAMNDQRRKESIAEESILKKQQQITAYRDMVQQKLGMGGMYDAAIRENSKFDEKLRATKEHLDEFDKVLSRIQRTLYAFAAVTALKYLSEYLTFPVEEAIRYNQEIEQIRLGIGSIIMAQTEFKNASGEQITGVEKLNKSLQLSDDIMQKLKVDNLKTVATFEQLAMAFQSALSPGLAAGMDLNQIREFSLAMVQAAGAMGVNLNMMAEELRSLLRGTITPRNTIIATNLGITNEDIRRYKADSTELFNFIMEKLKSFAIAGEASQKTFSGLWSNLKDAASMLFGEAGTTLFENLKKDMESLFNAIVQVDNVTKNMKINPELITTMKGLFSVVEAIAEVLSKITKGFIGLGIGIGGIANDIKKVWNMTDNFGGQEVFATSGGKDEEKVPIANEYAVALRYYRKYEELTDKYIKAKGKLIERGDPLATILNPMINYYRGQMETFRKAMELTGNEIEVVDGWTKSNAYAMNGYGISIRGATVDTKILQKELEAFRKELQKTEGGIETFSGKIEGKMIAALEKYEANIGGKSSGFAKVMAEYKKQLQELYKYEGLLEKSGQERGSIDAALKPIKDQIEYTKNLGLANVKFEEDREKAILAIEMIQTKVNNLQDRSNKLLERNKSLTEEIANANQQRTEVMDTIADLEERQKIAKEIYNEMFNVQMAMRGRFAIPEDQRQEMFDYLNELAQAYDEIDPGGNVSALINELQTKAGNLGEFIRSATESADQMLRQSTDAYNQKLYAMIDEWNRRLDIDNREKMDLRTVQEGITTFLKEQSLIENNLYETEKKREQLYRYMSENNLTGDEWQAAIQSLEKFDQTIIETQWQLQTIKETVSSLEGQRSIIMDVDSTDAFDTLTDINNAINEAKRIIEQPTNFGIETQDALWKLDIVEDKLLYIRNLAKSMDMIIDVKMALSPPRPFGEAYPDLIKKLNSVPRNSTYQIDVLMNEAGMSSGSAYDIIQSNNVIRNLRSQIAEAEELANYYHTAYNGLSFGMPAMESYYRSLIPELQNRLDAANLELYSKFRENYGSASGSSGSSSSGGGIELTVGSIIINMEGAGNSREDVILLADRIDEELALKIKASDSQIVNALKNVGIS